MKKYCHIAVTVLIMAVADRFAIRIVDATVQINDNWGILILFILLLDLSIAGLSRIIYLKFTMSHRRKSYHK